MSTYSWNIHAFAAIVVNPKSSREYNYDKLSIFKKKQFYVLKSLGLISH